MAEKTKREEEARIRAEMEQLRRAEDERNNWAATKTQVRAPRQQRPTLPPPLLGGGHWSVGGVCVCVLSGVRAAAGDVARLPGAQGQQHEGEGQEGEEGEEGEEVSSTFSW